MPYLSASSSKLCAKDKKEIQNPKLQNSNLSSKQPLKESWNSILFVTYLQIGWSHNAPSHPSSQLQVFGLFLHFPCWQPDKVMQFLQFIPVQPSKHLKWLKIQLHISHSSRPVQNTSTNEFRQLLFWRNIIFIIMISLELWHACTVASSKFWVLATAEIDCLD